MSAAPNSDPFNPILGDPAHPPIQPARVPIRPPAPGANGESLILSDAEVAFNLGLPWPAPDNEATG